MTSRQVTLKFTNRTASVKQVVLLYTNADTGLREQTPAVLVAGEKETSLAFQLDGSGDLPAADADKPFAVYAYEGVDDRFATVNQWYDFKAENVVELDFGRVFAWLTAVQWFAVAALAVFLIMAAVAFYMNSARASAGTGGGSGASQGVTTRSAAATKG